MQRSSEFLCILLSSQHRLTLTHTRSIQDRNKVYNAAPKGTTVNVDFSGIYPNHARHCPRLISSPLDIFDVGAVLTAGCGVLIVDSAFSLVSLFRPLRNNSAYLLRIQTWALFFCALWIFATVIPFDVFFATRSAKVTASLNGVPVSQAIIQSIEKSLGVSPIYKESWFCKLFALNIKHGITLTIFSSETPCYNTLVRLRLCSHCRYLSTPCG